MEKTEKDECQLRNRWGLGVRHFQAALTFCGTTVAYILRSNLNVAVVGMTLSDDYRVNLTRESKALVLSSMFWGYGILQVASGTLGRRGHAVKLFAFGNFGSGVISLMIPFAALHFGAVGICVLRFIVGLIQGNIYPNVNNVMAKWAIPQEKDPLMCIIFSGSLFGNLISLSASGYLGYNFDWPSIFYVSGLVGILWGIIHAILGGEGPESYQRISLEEREYIKKCFQAENREVQEVKAEVPWKQILTSVPVIALAVTAWCCYWASWTMSTLTPSYINGVLAYNLSEDGLLSSLPYLFACIATLVFSFVSGVIKKKTSIPDCVLRPFWNSISMYGSCAALMVLAFAPPNATLAITLLTISMTAGAANHLGFVVNSLDLSPNFAGVLMSVVNTTGNIASILGPLISTYLVKDNTDVYQWRIVFIISAMISFLGNTVFIFWGSTKKQLWDEGKRTSGETA